MLNLVLQVFDFFLKAAVHYGATDEGQRELSDILEAAEGTPFDFTPNEQGEPEQQPMVEVGTQAARRSARVRGR